ncbi:SDR family NAD(P)-dependent oxidoreductase [Novosphingobium sp. TH158]|uniref:SDR family NAD(P)-dependent oxidoreductase n=1 Tax=Novosphingobium sp. TH158 TaxID=2067455 RepID=UPI000C7C5589|nr:SDR family oxidoreductase [Novosphingobium sp. TH158]PLK24470.1 dehydrogenase [Novosphingobium sp. TH158]
MDQLIGKRAVVTGAAKGIGAAIARRFAEAGAQVLVADIDPAVEPFAAGIGQAGMVIDVGRVAELDRLFARVRAEWGGLDVLVNNAGVTHAATLDDLTEEDYDRVLGINLKSMVFATQRAARLMDRGGSVINMSSVNAVLAIPNQIPYAISKGGIGQLTTVTALSLAPRGIRVNAIGPGTILTDMGKAILADEAQTRKIMSRTPLGRAGEPEEVADIALFLASEQSSYVTGQTIYCDGGRLGLNYTM